MTTTPIQNRYEFVVLFDCLYGNPNGDPDAVNMPRIDPETNHGIITDVCLKSKIRHYVNVLKENADGYKIYINPYVPLESSDKTAYTYLGVTNEKDIKKDEGTDLKIKNFMCENFFDIRTFGAVMTTFVKASLNCGQVRGPVQFGFAKSVDPIMVQEITLTRKAITTEKDAQNKKTEIGKKYVVPYALYKCQGYVSANIAKKHTGFSEDDLNLLWEAILNSFEHDRSAARGNMAVRKLIIFKHKNELGEAPAWKLFDSVQINRKDNSLPARCYEDYEIIINKNDIPDGVECIEK